MTRVFYVPDFSPYKDSHLFFQRQEIEKKKTLKIKMLFFFSPLKISGTDV